MNKKPNMLKQIFGELMENCLGGDINAEVSEVKDNYIVMHFWDGRRFFLSCTEMEPGCAYHPETGRPITTAEFNEFVKKNLKKNLK